MRLPPLLPEQLDEPARAVYDAIAAGARATSQAFALTTEEGTLVGPFNAMLYSPPIGDALQRLGTAIRFESSLPEHIRELAILTVASHWRSSFEWWAHESVGRAAGLTDETIDSLRRGRDPTLSEDAAAVHALCIEVLRNGAATTPTFDRAGAALGDRGLVELVALIGYYTTLAMILSVFEVGVPGDEPSPFR
jgi:4-carboxymuconolactone decarboxylase